mmetsp:Transcript_27396/g.63272  ORF Transcript_27396/g.63272 Transcript_27396/m.63272 type:complete len:193 (+) Transcript_27396:1534-2112(+)
MDVRVVLFGDAEVVLLRPFAADVVGHGQLFAPAVVFDGLAERAGLSRLSRALSTGAGLGGDDALALRLGLSACLELMLAILLTPGLFCEPLAVGMDFCRGSPDCCFGARGVHTRFCLGVSGLGLSCPHRFSSCTAVDALGVTPGVAIPEPFRLSPGYLKLDLGVMLGVVEFDHVRGVTLGVTRVWAVVADSK